jgi:long-chain acyl-CoA synthetase
MYEQQRLNECEYILKDSGAKLLLVGSEETYDKTRHFLASNRANSSSSSSSSSGGVQQGFGGPVPSLKDIWTFDVDVPARMAMATPSMLASSLPSSSPTIHPDDVAVLIYTSGTTGMPKGVELTHGNLCSNIQGMWEVVKPEDMPDALSLAFLPWAHSIGLNCELFNMMSRGARVALAQDISTIASDIKEVQPNILFAVPTLYKKVYDKIQDKINASGKWSRWLVDTAVAVAEKRLHVLREGGVLSPMLQAQYRLMDRIVLSKLRETLGGKVQLSPVGGSKMSLPVTRFFEAALGIAILEGYGLSETSPLLSISRPEVQTRRLGSVGQAVKGAELAVVREGKRVPEGEEGEVWAAGPMVFKGYLSKAEETAAAFGELEGKKWFRTGDLGTLTQGFLTVRRGREGERERGRGGKGEKDVRIDA